MQFAWISNVYFRRESRLWFSWTIIPTIFRASFFFFFTEAENSSSTSAWPWLLRIYGSSLSFSTRSANSGIVIIRFNDLRANFCLSFRHADESTTRLDRAMDSLSLSPLVDIVYIPSKTRGESFRFPPRARLFRRYDRRASRFEDSANIPLLGFGNSYPGPLQFDRFIDRRNRIFPSYEHFSRRF